ncbi:unnamed protein product, partial [Mesorhabditis spiculigera]
MVWYPPEFALNHRFNLYGRTDDRYVIVDATVKTVWKVYVLDDINGRDNEQNVEQYSREAECNRRLLENPHPNLRSVRDGDNGIQNFRYDQDRKRYGVLEFVYLPSVLEKVIYDKNVNYTIFDVLAATLQHLEGIGHLHDKIRFIHGEIKADNIYIDENGIVKIGNFSKAVPLDKYGIGWEKDARSFESLLWQLLTRRKFPCGRDAMRDAGFAQLFNLLASLRWLNRIAQGAGYSAQWDLLKRNFKPWQYVDCRFEPYPKKEGLLCMPPGLAEFLREKASSSLLGPQEPIQHPIESHLSKDQKLVNLRDRAAWNAAPKISKNASDFEERFQLQMERRPQMKLKTPEAGLGPTTWLSATTEHQEREVSTLVGDVRGMLCLPEAQKAERVRIEMEARSKTEKAKSVKWLRPK